MILPSKIIALLLVSTFLPMVFSTEKCRDNPDYTFKRKNGKPGDCKWLSQRKKANKITKYCNKRKTRFACRFTCDFCPEPRVRRSVRELERMHKIGITKPLEDLIRAFDGIQNLHPTDLKSFFVFGGYHGEPFVGSGAIDGSFWGGFCNHGNVLFPTWHRAYVLKLEEALRSIDGCEDVTMPYWDETSEETIMNGLPQILTDETFTFKNGTQIKNPLQRYKIPVSIDDTISEKGKYYDYRKPAGYETVRYPFSGLVGTKKAKKRTERHNKRIKERGGHKYAVRKLNQNLFAWMTGSRPVIRPGKRDSIVAKFKSSLLAPNYTLFSNTVSANQHNNGTHDAVTSLEDPHNDIHVAVGGLWIKTKKNPYLSGLIPGSNGDMGEPNTAGFDPLFFFHHCNIDRVFWLWQKQNNFTNHFDIDESDPGAKSNTNVQGPTPYVGNNVTLTMDSLLLPFVIDEENNQGVYTSRDVINIETQLGYTYSAGSLEERPEPDINKSGKKIVISDIDGSLFSGSFIVSVTALIYGQEEFIGYNSAFSRWNPRNCLNCKTNYTVTYSLGFLNEEEIQNATFSVHFDHRGKDLPVGLDYKVTVI